MRSATAEATVSAEPPRREPSHSEKEPISGPKKELMVYVSVWCGLNLPLVRVVKPKPEAIAYIR
jgi:hypothetical protein